VTVVGAAEAAGAARSTDRPAAGDTEVSREPGQACAVVGRQPIARLHEEGGERQAGHPGQRPQLWQLLERPEHRLTPGRPASLLIDDMERTTEVLLGAQSTHLGPVLGSALEGHETQPLLPVHSGQSAGDARADATAPVIEDRQAALAHDARRRVGRTWMRTG
jgi:hypothetical protein